MAKRKSKLVPSSKRPNKRNLKTAGGGPTELDAESGSGRRGKRKGK